MLAPLLHLSRPKLREPNALAQSSAVREPRSADTNGEVLRAWKVRIHEAHLRALNQPEQCEREVCPELNRRSSKCLRLLESGMQARLKADARWQREGYENAWTRGWPREEPSVLFWRVASALTYARTPSNVRAHRPPSPDFSKFQNSKALVPSANGGSVQRSGSAIQSSSTQKSSVSISGLA